MTFKELYKMQNEEEARVNNAAENPNVDAEVKNEAATNANAEAETKTETEPKAETAAPAPAPTEAEIKLAEKVAMLQDRVLRAQADFDNFRKRQIREKEDWIKTANADLMEALLPALDTVGLAIDNLKKTENAAENPWMHGFELVQKTFLDSLGRFGLAVVPNPVGKPLDPHTAEAVSVMPTGQAEPGHVLFETRRGYTLNGKLLRAAQVVVEAEQESGEQSESGAEAAAPAAQKEA